MESHRNIMYILTVANELEIIFLKLMLLCDSRF